MSQDEPFDLRSGEIDVVMRFGVPPFADGRSVASTHDRYYPVCSPAFAQALASALRPAICCRSR